MKSEINEKKEQCVGECCHEKEQNAVNGGEGRCCGGNCSGEGICCKEGKESNEKLENGMMQRDAFEIRVCAVLFHKTTKKVCVARVAFTKGRFYTKYGPWDLFGGHVKTTDASPEDALRREVLEESGQEIGDGVALGAFPFGGYGNSEQRILIGYAVECDSEDIVLSREHSEFRWESVDTLLASDEYKPWMKDLVQRAHRMRESFSALNGWKQCAADFENYKKSQMNLGKEYAARAIENFVGELLPVSDNFHASTDHIPEDQKSGAWVQGILYIQQQLDTLLTEIGAEVIATKKGDVFDPSVHEAMGTGENEALEKTEESETHTIVKVIQKGYRYGGKVIRPARVTVQ